MTDRSAHACTLEASDPTEVLSITHELSGENKPDQLQALPLADLRGAETAFASDEADRSRLWNQLSNGTWSSSAGSIPIT
jgi:hypothetical protein